jgi:uncharacterized protein
MTVPNIGPARGCARCRGSRRDDRRTPIPADSGANLSSMSPLATLVGTEVVALEELRAFLDERFGARVRELSIFGSAARGERHEDSDVDVLVVVDDLSSAERREIAWFSGDLLTRHDVLIAPLAMSTAHRQELHDRELGLSHELDRDGIPL